jgi:hypoxia up-regulated 1
LHETSDADLTGKLKGLFDGGASSSDEATAESAEDTPPRDSESASASAASSSSGSASTSAAAEKKKTKKATAPVENTIPLSLEVTFPTIPPMTVEQKKISRSKFVILSFCGSFIFIMYSPFPPFRLRAIDAEELTKTRREEARNTFESYLYRLRDLLSEDNKSTPSKKCSQPCERNAITEKLDESFAWLSDRGDLAETSQFLDKRIALEYVASLLLFFVLWGGI